MRVLLAGLILALTSCQGPTSKDSIVMIDPVDIADALIEEDQQFPLECKTAPCPIFKLKTPLAVPAKEYYINGCGLATNEKPPLPTYYCENPDHFLLTNGKGESLCVDVKRLVGYEAKLKP